jgi:glycosyltransferase involved in cell wall biosynthesis
LKDFGHGNQGSDLEDIMPIGRKNILFIISGLSMGGAERLLINLVNGFDKKRFSVCVIALSRQNSLAGEICSEDIGFTCAPREWRYDLQPARQIRQTIMESKTDTVIAFDLFSYFYARYALLGTHLKPKLLISLHATNPKNVKHFLQSMVYVRMLSRDGKIISVCNKQAEYFSKVYGVPQNRFTTIYNGVDVAYFHPADGADARRSIRASAMIPTDAFVILQVASLAPHKCHEDSLAALKELTDHNPKTPFYLLLVGQGLKDREEKLRALAADLMISEHVRFCGLQRDVRPFYQAADLFTLSSQSIETFSVAALEAMSMGLPCVITDVGGAREMIVEGVNGYVVPARNPHALANAWQRAMDGQDMFNHEKIRAWVIEHFNLADCIRKYEDLAC